MTYEEAKEYMGKKLRCNRSDFALCEQYRVCKGCPNDVDLDLFPEVMEMAIEALEKQIPKKPIYEADGYSDGCLVYDMWRCPNCDELYEVDYDDYDFCPRCGQRIDFTEEGAEE